MPPNLQTVSLKFARRRSAKVMGSLAVRDATEPEEGEEVRGVLVTNNFTSKIVKAEDLATYTPLRVGSISSKLHVPFSGSIETLRLFFNEMFAGVNERIVADNDRRVNVFSFHEDQVCIGNIEECVSLQQTISNESLFPHRSLLLLERRIALPLSSGRPVPPETLWPMP